MQLARLWRWGNLSLHTLKLLRMQQGSLLLAIDTLIVYMFQVLYFKAVERGWLKKWYYGDVLVYAVSCSILFHAVSLCEPNLFCRDPSSLATSCEMTSPPSSLSSHSGILWGTQFAVKLLEFLEPLHIKEGRATELWRLGQIWNPGLQTNPASEGATREREERLMLYLYRHQSNCCRHRSNHYCHIECSGCE